MVWRADAPGGVGGLVLLQAYLGDDPDTGARIYGVYRPVYDARGNVVALIDSSGAVAEYYQYDAFGRTKIFAPDGTQLAKSAVGNIFLFSTKSYDFDFALYHFGARWYDPATGRFISPDPLGFVDGPNPYLYVAGDPVQFIDPWGLCSQHGTWRDRLAVARSALRDTGQGVGEIVQGLYPSTVGNILDLAHGAGANLGFADPDYEPQGAVSAWVARAYDPRIRWYNKIPIGGPIGQAWGTSTWAFWEHPGILTGLRFTRDIAAVGSTALSGAFGARVMAVPGTYQETATVVAPKKGTDVYRVVEKAELDDIERTGVFRFREGSSTPEPGLEGKWFYESLDDADVGASKTMRPSERAATVRVTVPEEALKHPFPNVDGVQRVQFIEIDDLSGLPIKKGH